jgi:CRP-like cAMP-binding protein
VVVFKEQDRREVELARLGPGEVFGEMALMTGEPRTATVRAASPSALLVIDHSALRQVLARAPELAGRLSLVMAERNARAADGAGLGAAAEERSAESRQLLAKIRSFFKLG